MKDDIKEHIENVLEKVTGKGECINADYVKGLLCGVLNSLEPNQAYFQKGDDAVFSDSEIGSHIDNVFLLRKFSHMEDGAYIDNRGVGWVHCKKIQILEESETCLVFKPERPELGEGDLGWIVLFSDIHVVAYRKHESACFGSASFKGAKYAIWKGE